MLPIPPVSVTVLRSLWPALEVFEVAGPVRADVTEP